MCQDGRDYDYLGLFFYPISELLDYVVASLSFSSPDSPEIICVILYLCTVVHQGIQDIVGTDYGRWAPYAMAFSYR